MSNKNDLRNIGSNLSTSEYVDNEGYKVWEYISPDTHIVTKTKNGKTQYEYTLITGNTKSIYKGTFSDSEMYNWQKEFDKNMDDWNKELERWFKDLDNSLFKSQIPNIPSVPNIPVGENFEVTHTPLNNYCYQVKKSQHNVGCFGCLIIQIIIVVILIAVIYLLYKVGIGIGSFLWEILLNLIDWIKGLL